MLEPIKLPEGSYDKYIIQIVNRLNDLIKIHNFEHGRK